MIYKKQRLLCLEVPLSHAGNLVIKVKMDQVTWTVGGWAVGGSCVTATWIQTHMVGAGKGVAYSLLGMRNGW